MVLGIPSERVLVVDVREDHITFDILQRELEAERFFGKRDAILAALETVPGFRTTPESDVHSDGVLGMINLPLEEAPAVLAGMRDMGAEIRARIAKRAVVFATGFEVEKGYIEDTNSPYLMEALGEAGFDVVFGGILPDDRIVITARLEAALNEGRGLILTTGGVGAEDKDHTVEAIQDLVPTAATPYIVHFKQGTGRHVKDGVRIAVAVTGPSCIVALPGPNDEVRLALPVLLEALAEGAPQEVIAERVAGVLARKLAAAAAHWHAKHAAEAAAAEATEAAEA